MIFMEKNLTEKLVSIWKKKLVWLVVNESEEANNSRPVPGVPLELSRFGIMNFIPYFSNTLIFKCNLLKRHHQFWN